MPFPFPSLFVTELPHLSRSSDWADEKQYVATVIYFSFIFIETKYFL